MRYSHQRELILREVLSRSDYPTAEQICTSLRAVCPRLSLGTVYRDLNTLVDIGKVRRVSIPGEADRFEGPQEDHQQLYCRSCQKVKSIHISDAKLKALIVGREGGQQPRAQPLVQRGRTAQRKDDLPLLPQHLRMLHNDLPEAGRKCRVNHELRPQVGYEWCHKWYSFLYSTNCRTRFLQVWQL